MDARLRPSRGIYRISTSPRARPDPSVIIEVGGRRVMFEHAQSDRMELATLRGNLEQECRAGGVEVAVFVHRNRDNSLAIAVGERPDVWPEDEPKPPDILNGEE